MENTPPKKYPHFVKVIILGGGLVLGLVAHLLSKKTGLAFEEI